MKRAGDLGAPEARSVGESVPQVDEVAACGSSVQVGSGAVEDFDLSLSGDGDDSGDGVPVGAIGFDEGANVLTVMHKRIVIDRYRVVKEPPTRMTKEGRLRE